MARLGQATDNLPIQTVSELSSGIKRTLEMSFSHIRVRGELSRVTHHRNGHIYTDLKDENAVINTVAWKSTPLPFKLEEGLEVIVTGRVSSFPGMSRYQLIIESIELAGEGAILKMIEARRVALAKEGLFDETRKKPLPFAPARIGVITSPTGAVIRDIIHRVSDRYPAHIILWPVNVQGENAAMEICKALTGFNMLPNDHELRPDVLILARGGGSIEDLMPFNEEAVVRTVAGSKIPIITAVGHETDTTLVDYASDLRAPTPTGAAEKATPVRSELIQNILTAAQRAQLAMMRRVEEAKLHLRRTDSALLHPRRQLEQFMQKLDDLSVRLDPVLTRWVMQQQKHLLQVAARLRAPTERVHLAQQNLQNFSQRMSQNWKSHQQRLRHMIESRAALLESFSYKNTLARGYALVMDKNNNIIATAKAARVAAEINIQFADDKISAKTSL
ncbi:MAG TPA: exodeoxyribonuclease VII large subunit [Alphaproteobacteria bacterium]|nr:exodeoxyribonuclease VII large subunit [Alphaproteobacteria bacterium]